MIEPAASLRLQRVRDAYESSLLLPPRPLASSVGPTASSTVHPLPSVVYSAIDRAPADRAPVDRASADRIPGDRPAAAPVPALADGYLAFREGAFAAESVSAAFLSTIASQAEALALVWEAHARGAVTLPPTVAAAVRAARAAAH